MPAELFVRPASRGALRALVAITLVLGAAAACNDDNPTQPRATLTVTDLQLKPGTEAGPLAVATFTARNADSARAWFTKSGAEPRATPFYPVHDGNGYVVVTGLDPSSDFAIDGDPLNGFSGQHFARVLPDNHLLIYDNGTGHDPNVSRPVEYALDTENKTATMVWDFLSSDKTYTTYMGSAQRLPDGNTLIGYSTAAIITLVDPNGTVLAKGSKMDGGNSSIFYRALWVPRL